MLKMIIVDDEPDMLEGIINHMPFAELGIEISAICENGLDGLNSITSIRPDIILCDISMPKMNGFEMLEKLRLLSDYDPQVIMLTGHDDFTHAKEAIKYQVMDYLVKPVMPADILAAITQAKKLCESTNTHRQTAINSLKASFIETLFSENVFTEDELLKKQKELNIPLNAQNYICILFYLRDYDLLLKQNTHDKLTALKSEIISAFKSSFPDCCYTHFNSDNIRFLILAKEDLKQTEITEKCSKIFNNSPLLMHSFICISRRCSTLSELPSLAKQAEYCCKFNFCFPSSAVLLYDTVSRYMKAAFEASAFSILEKIVADMKIKNIIEWHTSIDQFKATLNTFEYYDPNYIKTLIYQAMNSIFSTILPDYTATTSTDEHANLWDNIQEARSQEELFSLCHRVADEFKDIADASVSQRSLLLSEQMKQYVKDNYMKQVTVVALSKHFYLSPNYMRQLFLNVNGITFKNYLKQHRMKKAKEMLTTGNYKIYEVAINVGYNDIKSFRSAFIEHFGISPSEMLQRPNDKKSD